MAAIQRTITTAFENKVPISNKRTTFPYMPTNVCHGEILDRWRPEYSPGEVASEAPKAYVDSGDYESFKLFRVGEMR